MPAMDGMMHGSTTSSMVSLATGWETWLAAGASFFVMWLVMTLVMMIPSMAPTLWRYRQALARVEKSRCGGLTALAGAAYLFVWMALGLIVFLVGAVLATVEAYFPALTRAEPIAVGLVVVIAGGIQLTGWKARRLALLRASPPSSHHVRAESGSAWRYGLRLGRDCGLSCAGPMASLLVLGVMGPRAMAIATVAITAERLAPGGERVARVLGLGAIVVGATLIARGAP